MTRGIVKQIGVNAIDEADEMLILFGEGATDELRKVSIIQELQTDGQSIELVEQGVLSFDQTDYHITHVGHLAIEQLNAIGHMTIVFKEVPVEDPLVNAIYVTPFKMPIINEGSIITYH